MSEQYPSPVMPGLTRYPLLPATNRELIYKVSQFNWLLKVDRELLSIDPGSEAGVTRIRHAGLDPVPLLINLLLKHDALRRIQR